MEFETFRKELEKRSKFNTERQKEKPELVKIDTEKFIIRWNDISNILNSVEVDIVRMLNILAYYSWKSSKYDVVFATEINREKEKVVLSEGFIRVKNLAIGSNRHTCASFKWLAKNSSDQKRYQYYAVTLNIYWARHFHRPSDTDYSVESGKGLVRNLNYRQMQEVLLDSFHNGPCTHWE